MPTKKPKIVALDDFDKQLIPTDLKRILKTLSRAGYDAYLVGGCIRDYLLGHMPKDFDTTTNASPEKVRQLIPNATIIGRRFRLVHVCRHDTVYEIATYRREPPATIRVFRRRRYTLDNTYGNQRQDAFRRDFTVNALYLDPRQYNVVDYVGGLSDLDARVIRSIGAAEKRFIEDPVRMIRAVRFAAKLDFEIDQEGIDAIATTKSSLRHVSRPRMRDELVKLFLTGHGAASYQLMADFNLLAEVFPQHPNAATLIELAMLQSDRRVASSDKLSPAFLFAVMLWHLYTDRLQDLQAARGLEADVGKLRVRACKDVVRLARQFVSIDRKSEEFIQSVFMLQSNLERRKRVKRTLAHPSVRAAVHLLSFRAKTGEIKPSVAAWWKNRQPPSKSRIQPTRDGRMDHRRTP